MTLREQVERVLPGWESWYPSLFDAAMDLGIIRAQVCPPSELLLSKRHARIRDQARTAHRLQWGGTEHAPGPKSTRAGRRARRQ